MVSFTKIRNGASSELIAHKKNRVVSILLLAFAGLFYGIGISYVGIALFLYGAALICLFSACVNVFKDMHDIPSADVQMSMPLNSIERYFSRLLAIVYIWVLPFAISAACAFILSMFITSVNDFGTYYLNWAAELAVFNLKLLAAYIETVLYIIAVTVICQCCVGSKAESRYMPLLLMAVLTVLPITLYSSFNTLYSDDINENDRIFKLLLNPMLFSLFDDEAAVEEFLLSALKSLAYLAVIGCSVFIYKKRDARSVGRPIAFTAFFEIIMGLSLLLFFTVSHMAGDFSFTAMFFAWLGSIILRVISSRKEFTFTKIFRWSGLYLVYYAAFLLFMFIAFKTDGFGALYHNIPDMSYIKNNHIYKVTVYVYTPEDGYKGYEQSDLEYRKTAAAHNNEDIKDFMELTVSKAKMQKGLNKIYLREMFGNKVFSEEIRKECCYVTVYLATDRENFYHWYRSYSINFYIPRSEKDTFIREFEEFDGFEDFSSK